MKKFEFTLFILRFSILKLSQSNNKPDHCAGFYFIAYRLFSLIIPQEGIFQGKEAPSFLFCFPHKEVINILYNILSIFNKKGLDLNIYLGVTFTGISKSNKR